MVAAVIGEELGLVGLFVLVGLFGMFGYAGLRAAHRARDRFSKLLAAGLTSLILAQAALNLFAVFGLAPLTGVPLPFVSYGGTSLVMTLASAGLILNVARRPAAQGPAGEHRAARAGPAERPAPRPGALRDWGLSTAARVLRAKRGAPRRKRVASGSSRDSGRRHGGRVVPAIAVADALRAEDAEVSFLGTRARAEADLVPAAGYEIDFLRVSGLDRRNPLKAAAAIWRAARAVGAARRLLGARRADVMLGAGGYVAGPAGLAAVRMGIPLVLAEADSHLGLANRMLARRARRVCLSFPIPGRDGGPYLLTGRPIPRAVLEADAAIARRRFGIPEPADCVTVVGGSLGARSINLAAFEAFTRLERGLPHDHVGQPWILHVAGRRDCRAQAPLGRGGAPGALSADRV